MLFKRLLAVLFVFALVPAAAAQGPDWRGLLQDWLDAFNAEHEAFAFTLEGLYPSEESETAARLAFDSLLMRYGEIGVARTGPGTLDLAETEQGLIAFGPASLTSPMTFLKAPGAKPLTLSFDLKRLEGLADRESGVLHAVDLLFEQVAARREERDLLKAGRLGFESEVTALDRGRYDQRSLLTLQGLDLSAPDSTLMIERMVARLENKEVDPDALMAWSERLRAAEERLARDPLPALSALWRESSGALLLAGLSAKDRDGKQILWLEDLRLESAVARGSAIDRMNVTLLLEGSGLEVSSEGDARVSKVAGLVPTAWRLPLVVEDLPSEALGNLLLDIAAGGPARAGPVIVPDRDIDLEPFFQALRRAGSRLVVRDLTIEGPAGSLSGSGEFTLDRRHPFGLVGEASFLLGGVKEAEAAMEASDDPEIAKFAFLFTTILKGLGEAEVGDDGQIVYRYELEFREDGSSLLNGLALDSLLQR